MNKLVMLLLAVAGLTAFAPNAIEARQGYYVGVLGGANFLQTSKHDGVEFEFDTGYDVGGFLGYEFCGGFAVEAEFTYRHNELRKVKFDCESVKAHGHFNSMSYMANVIYNWDLSRCWCIPVTPYLGAGIGYAQQKLSYPSEDESDCGCESTCEDTCKDKNDNKKNGFAWQIIAGIGYKISPCFDIALDYRFNEGQQRRFYNHSLGVLAAYHF